MKVYTINQWRM